MVVVLCATKINKKMESTQVSSIMSKNVVGVSSGQKIIDVKHIYEKDNFHRHIPVIDNNKLVGMVSLVDFMYNIKGAGLDDSNEIYSRLYVKDIMTSNPSYKSPNATIKEVAQELSKGEFHAIPIVEEGSVVGMVSTVDIIKYFLNK